MRYFITLLVVLSVTTSFGSFELESAQTVGANRFGVTVGGILCWDYGLRTRLGVEYGLLDFLSIGLKGNYKYSYSDHYSSQLNLCLNLKANISFYLPIPISLSLSLGGELNNQIQEYDIDDEYNIDATYYSLRGNLAFQVWFVYFGFASRAVSDDGYLSVEWDSMNFGLDIEFNDNLSMLIELGSSTGYYYYFLSKIAIGIETTF